MTGPWFRRYAGFSYIPTTWQGWAVIAAMVAVFIPCVALSMSLGETQPTLAWVIESIGVLAVFVGHVVVFWKMDWGY